MSKYCGSWISVEDQLPPDYQEVMFFAKSSSNAQEIMIGHREHRLWYHCCWFYSSMRCDSTIIVTHWMELPEYPTIEQSHLPKVDGVE